MRQARVGDLRVADRKLLKVCESAHVSQPDVGDCRTIEAERFEPPKTRQTRHRIVVRDLIAGLTFGQHDRGDILEKLVAYDFS